MLAALAAATTGCAGSRPAPAAESPRHVTVEPRIADDDIAAMFQVQAVAVLGIPWIAHRDVSDDDLFAQDRV